MTHLTASADVLADLTAQNIATIRLASMFAVLAGGLVCGHLIHNRLSLPERFAKKIMTAVLMCFSWPIALFVIWPMQLSGRLIWLPVVGLILMLLTTILSTALFSFFNITPKRRLTLIMAGGLSNHGYTGGAFVCYALFGTTGLALANIYCVFWVPAAFVIFLPLLKIHQIRAAGSTAQFKLGQMLDLRMLIIPAVIVAVMLNLADVEYPALISQLYLVDILVYTAAGLSFFAIGLQVNMGRLKNYISLYSLLAALKFILTPVLAFAIIGLLVVTGQGLTSLAQKVIVVMSLAPSAVFMVTMSSVFDLDSPLASALWVVNTAIFVVIIVPVLFLIFN